MDKPCRECESGASTLLGATMTNEPDTTKRDGKTETLVAHLLPVSEQIGRNVMAALDDPDSVAVLTTVVTGVGADRVVSVGLTPKQMHDVGVLLQEIEEEDEDAAQDDQRCIGFQCKVSKD
jgi:hypothetical protein